jgi:ribosomal protein S18 acetylase RimI-like enzyme
MAEPSMSDRTPIPLTPKLIELDSPEFEEICLWRFDEDYVGRRLQDAIPWRVQRGTCQIWAYRDPDGQVVGFGTIDVCLDYGDLTGARPHPYIPLLAVNKSMEGRGHGKWIVRHLIGEAAILATGPGACYEILFLDVYTDNTRAIGLYEKCGFIRSLAEPRLHQEEGNRPYIITEMRVSMAPI